MKHNVYDFDKTIYMGDSTIDFYLFCLKKHPGILVEIPVLLAYLIMHMFKMCSKTTFKEKFFRFLRHVDSIDDLLIQFWNINHSKIASFYIKGHNENDIIISASPEFLLQPICNSLNVQYLIASKVDKNTGLYSGENCWGEEKVRRLREKMPDAAINEFYSDSLSDAPIAEIAEKAYIVQKNRIILWSDYHPSFFDIMTRTYLSRDFMLFIFCGGMGTLTNFVFSLIISMKVNTTLSYVFGYAISLFVAYALNASLIYKEKYRLNGFIKFVVSYIPNFLILLTFVAVFLNIFHWNKVIVYALAGLLGLPVTYLLVKIFAFGKREE